AAGHPVTRAGNVSAYIRHEPDYDKSLRARSTDLSWNGRAAVTGGGGRLGNRGGGPDPRSLGAGDRSVRQLDDAGCRLAAWARPVDGGTPGPTATGSTRRRYSSTPYR